MSEQHPLVSVILPTYNRAGFLVKAINSVVTQSFQDWELIVWDDGSTDETRRIVETINDSRISYHFSENFGVAYARNRAIEKSSTKYIAFLDSDDQWLANKLSMQVAAMEENPDVDLLFTNFINVNIQKETEEVEFEKYASEMSRLRVDERYNNIKVVKNLFLECIVKENFIATDTVLLKRVLLENIGGFNETLRNSEDFELWWRAGLSNAGIAYVDEVHLIRNKPPDSLSCSSSQATLHVLKALDLCASQATNTGRSYLVPMLNAKYRNAWQYLIRVNGTSGNISAAFHAFLNSIKYGLRPGSVKLLIKALMDNR
jgi:glycosyltransferase involved in cell wall biosynthesis